MTVEAMCAAAVEYSDNTTANLLLQSIGGPSKLTEYLRSIGDKVTRLDRNEPELNTAIAGDPRDTATPTSMLNSVNTLVLWASTFREFSETVDSLAGREYDRRSSTTCRPSCWLAHW
jgi:beta-lactamase class A